MNRISKIITAFLMVWLGLAFIQAIQVGLHKFYSIDEFQYAHAAWLVSKGFVPYRDFFEHHFPFLYQLASPLFLLNPDDPTQIQSLRWFMIPWWSIVVLAVGYLNRRFGFMAVLSGMIALLTTASFVERVTEIRPDVLSLAFFLVGLVFVSMSWKPKLKLFFLGLLLAASFWSSQKAVYYGWIIFLPFFIPKLSPKKNILLGFGTFWLAVLIYLAATRSLASWFQWSIQWSLVHQTEYPGFPWTRYFLPVATQCRGLLLFALLGWITSARAWRRNGRTAGEFLVLASWPSTFLSILLQKAAYPYSFIPFLAISALLAGRCVIPLKKLLAKISQKKIRGLIGVCLGVSILWYGTDAYLHLLLRDRNTNRYQHHVLSEISNLVSPGRPVYDNSGGYVARPHVHFFFYTDSLIRKKFATQLITEIPDALEKTECVAFLRDLRFDSLPEPLKDYLRKNYMPLNGDLWIRGERFSDQDYAAPLNDIFHAIRSGYYFVSPASIITEGRLFIDDEPASSVSFKLDKGLRRIRYEGEASEFFILWLPEDGKTFVPNFDDPPKFSRLFS